MPILLEVIVTSVVEAVEAEQGGADRLELIRELAAGGLSPSQALVEEVLNAVRIPVRVMVRENSTLQAGDEAECELLARQVNAFAKLPLDGLVIGFAKDGELDLNATRALLAEVPAVRATFHRAFDEARDPLAAIGVLRDLPQIDRVLTSGGNGNTRQRIESFRNWQQAAQPGIQILAGIGLSEELIDLLKQEAPVMEVHAGRAVREPKDVCGSVRRERVAALKSKLA